MGHQMGTLGDIKKKLKQHGFKPVSTNRHAVYQNDEGRIVRVHLGSAISDARYRTVMKDIERGNVVAGKVEKDQAPLVWTKINSQHHVLSRGIVEIGRVNQVFVNADNQWGWAVDVVGSSSPSHVHNTLAEAKAYLERL